MKVTLISMILAMQLSGCTVMGTVLGSQIPRKPVTIEGWQPENIKKGQKVQIMMTDSTLQTGYFQENQVEPFDSYAARYQNWNKERGNINDVPLPDDLISVSSKDTVRTGTFKGFDKGILYLRYDRGGYDTILMDDITDIRIDKRVVFDMERLNILLDAEELPLRTTVVLSDRKGTEVWSLKPGEVEQVQVYGKHFTGAGFLVGVFIDVMYVFSNFP